MKLKRLFPLCVGGLVFLAAFGAGPVSAQEPKPEVPEPIRSLIIEARKRAADFPLLPVGTKSGVHQTFRIRLDEKPVAIGEHRFACARFVAPEEAGLDMVWAFSTPPEWAQWYILPASGEMEGFRSWFDADRLYEELPATPENAARLQILSAKSLKPGATYILWFKAEGAATDPATLTGAINFVRPPTGEKAWDNEQIEKTLGLKTAPEKDQVTYLKSRGGQVLLDARFFEPGYAKSRIRDVLYSLRSAQRFGNGFFIETRMSEPPCKTDPLLADIQAAYGEADLVLSPTERLLFEKDAPADEAVHYYDHFAFVVREKEAKPHVQRVTTQAPDASLVRPLQEGLTWGDVPMPEMRLRVFYRDRKEIARIAFWGESQAKVLSGELPADTFKRGGKSGQGSEELQHLGQGQWQYRAIYPNGQTARSTALQNHAYEGPYREFYADGKPLTEATYLKGRLDGVLKQWREGGQSRELRYRAGELIRDGTK